MVSNQGLVDVHQHFFSPGQKARERERQHGHMTPQERLQEWSAEHTLQLMDAHGIAYAVGSISTPGVWLGSPTDAAACAREWNEFGATLAARHPTRLGFFAALPLPAT